MLINFYFLIKKDFWYAGLIVDFTDSEDKILAQSKKSRKVDAITSILQKIQIW